MSIVYFCVIAHITLSHDTFGHMTLLVTLIVTIMVTVVSNVLV